MPKPTVKKRRSVTGPGSSTGPGLLIPDVKKAAARESLNAGRGGSRGGGRRLWFPPLPLLLLLPLFGTTQFLDCVLDLRFSVDVVEVESVVEGIGGFVVAAVTAVAVVLASIFTSVAGATASLLAATLAVVPRVEAAAVGSEYLMMAVVVVLSMGTLGAAE